MPEVNPGARKMALHARREWTKRHRRSTAGSQCPDHKRSRGLRSRRGDSGFGLIEAVISISLLALIVVPITRLVVTTEAASNNLHLRAEAADLATQALETGQYQTANGVIPTAGITTTTQYSGSDRFHISVDWELVAGTGASSTMCIVQPGQVSSRIWTLKATVTWGTTGAQAGKVVMTTLVSPSLADLADTNAAEIAVPVDNADLSPDTATPVSITVTGQCVGSQCSTETVPSNEVITETANTGSSGCAVFTNLFAGAGYSYNATATPPTGYVDLYELSSAQTANGLPTETGINVTPNTVQPAPPFILAPGATETVGFQTVLFTPITVANVTTSNTKTNVTVTSGGFPGVAVGMIISGSGIQSGTTVSSISGNTLTMSLAATATGTATLSFSGFTIPPPAPYIPITVQSLSLLCSARAAETCVLGNPTGTIPAFNSNTSSLQTALLYPGPTVTGSAPNYSAWSGDQADSQPSYQDSNGNSIYGSDTATTFQALPNTSGSLTLPVYPLVLKLTINADAHTVTALTASDAGGGDTFSLYGTSGSTFASNGTSSTGLPLGEFQLQATVSSGGNNAVSPSYVWILPTGVCTSSNVNIDAANCTPSISTLAVTIG